MRVPMNLYTYNGADKKLVVKCITGHQLIHQAFSRELMNNQLYSLAIIYSSLTHRYSCTCFLFIYIWERCRYKCTLFQQQQKFNCVQWYMLLSKILNTDAKCTYFCENSTGIILFLIFPPTPTPNSHPIWRVWRVTCFNIVLVTFNHDKSHVICSL